MIYKMELSDSTDTMVFDLLEVPIEDKDVTGVASNTTIDGNVFNDYLWLKKQYVQKWSIMCQDEYERLRGFWTRQFGNAEVPFYRLFYGDNVYEDKNFLTSDGMTQILNPTERTAPLSLTHLYGNATQETTTGKNMFCIATSGNKRIGGLDFTIDDGILHINGTTTGASYYYFDTFHVPNSGSAILSMSVVGTVANWANAFGIRVSNDGQTWSNVINIAPPTLSGTLTLDSSKYYQCFWYVNASGVVYNNVGFKVQLEYGSTPTEWEKYTGGVPMPNPDFPSDVNVVSGAQEVKIHGKNMWGGQDFDGNSAVSATVKYNADGTVSVTGANNVLNWTLLTSSAYPGNHMLELPAGTYAFYVDGSTYDTQLVSTKTDGTNERADITINGGVGSATFTTTETRLFYPRCRIPVGATDKTIRFMIVKGVASQMGDYEPYHGQSQEINLGKNLFDKQTLGLGKNWVGSVGTICYPYQDLSTRAVGLIPVKPNATYTIQLLQSDWYIMQVLEADSSYEDIHNIASPQDKTLNITFKTMSQTAYIGVKFKYGSAGTTDITSDLLDSLKLQLELGRQATSYAPYKTPIELAKIGNYTDGFRIIDGTWYIHKEVGKVVYDGSNDETWGMYANGKAFRGSADNMARSTSATSDAFILSDYYLASTETKVYMGSVDYGIASASTTDQLMLRNKDLTTEAGLRTWLSTHNTTVYYPLATPTDTAITDSDLIAQLDHIYSLYGGVNNLWLIPSGGAQGEMAGDYRLIYEEETDIIPKTPVVLTLSDGGVINPCGCRQNIQLIMRETKGSE